MKHIPKASAKWYKTNNMQPSSKQGNGIEIYQEVDNKHAIGIDKIIVQARLKE